MFVITQEQVIKNEYDKDLEKELVLLKQMELGEKGNGQSNK